MSVFIRRRSSRGELAITLALTSLVIMVIGSLLGARVSDRSALTSQSNAAGLVQCGQTTCKRNSDCAQNTGFTVLCHVSSGQCRPMLATDSCPGGGSPRIDKVRKNEGQSCSRTIDCKTGLVCAGFPRVCRTSNPTSSLEGPFPTSGGRIIINPTFPGGGGGSGGGSGGSCIFHPTAFVNIRASGDTGMGERLTADVNMEPNVVNWTTQNDVGSPPAHFSRSGEVDYTENIAGKSTCCGGYPVTNPPAKASVTLTNFDTSKYKIVETCGPNGCAPATGSGRTINNLPIACSTYSYGWILECNSNRSGECPIIQETDVTRFETTVGECEATFTQVADPNIYKITIGRSGEPVLFTADENTQRKSGDLNIPFYIAFKNHSVNVNYDPRQQQDVAITVRNPSQHQATYDRQGLVKGTGADPMVVTLYYFFKQGVRGDPSRQTTEYRQQSVTTRGGCESRSNVTPTVVTPTVTEEPTPTVTDIPTPTVVTPTETPPVTPQMCQELQVNFIIDYSSSVNVAKVYLEGAIRNAISQYRDSHPGTNLIWSWSYFDHTGGKDSGSSSSKSQDSKFNVPLGHNWTNIKDGLDKGMISGAVNFLFTDGFQTVQDLSSVAKCAVDNSQCVADPCLALDGTCPRPQFCRLYKNVPGQPDTCPASENFSREWAICSTCSQLTREKADTTLVQAYGRKVSYTVKMRGDDRGDQTLKSLSSTGDFIEVSELASRLDALLTQECAKSSVGLGNSQRSQGVGYSMGIENNSSGKTISSFSINLCDQNNTCENKTIDQRLSTGGKTTSSAVFSTLNNSPLLSNNQYTVKCSVNYTNGKSDSCGERSINGDDGIQYRLTVDERGVVGSPKTYAEASDFDKNNCVNALDYARLLKQSTSNAKPSENFDIIIDDQLNAQDRSVVLNNIGKLCGSK